jgi:hypothetical protein
MILVSLATITDQVNKLVELLSIASPYARASYRAKKHPHVIICGSMTLVSFALILFSGTLRPFSPRPCCCC